MVFLLPDFLPRLVLAQLGSYSYKMLGEKLLPWFLQLYWKKGFS